ncbi:MAG: DUF4197 domain-containing protein, partial [Taibaiella sp.]|nr:DUF4197 domain-containing protein [Taibaiella sp.]
MSKIAKLVTGIALVGMCTTAHAQLLRDYMNDASRVLKGAKKSTSKTTITNTEITEGLRQALELGAKTATNQLSAPNGFFGNALVKVLMPPEAKKVEDALRHVGMGTYVDKAILSMNRAAEDATKQALPIFGNAIKSMTIQDAIGILKGSNDAATQYLKSKTTTQLTSAFRPIISASLDKVNATKYWAEVFEVYNNLPTTFNKVNPDLSAYVTERALNGVFVYVAEEENKIRLNPAERVTDILKKVFGQFEGGK